LFKSINKFVLTGLILTVTFFTVIGILDLLARQDKPRSPLGDGGLLSREPCGPPCFFGIIPGVSSKDDAITMLRSHELYLDCSEYDNTSQGGFGALPAKCKVFSSKIMLILLPKLVFNHHDKYLLVK
jgi:hypothetical protein